MLCMKIIVTGKIIISFIPAECRLKTPFVHDCRISQLIRTCNTGIADDTWKYRLAAQGFRQDVF